MMKSKEEIEVYFNVLCRHLAAKQLRKIRKVLPVEAGPADCDAALLKYRPQVR
jgi:hypothetical protein